MPQLNHEGISLCYETQGNPKNPCLVLIMGISGQLISWSGKFIQSLVRQNFYVITFDHRDVGLSNYYPGKNLDLNEVIKAKQAHESFIPPYTLDDMATDVRYLLDGLEIKKSHILGISMGGMIGQLFAINYPDRCLSLTCIASTSSENHLPPCKPEVLELFFSNRVKQQGQAAYVEDLLRLNKIYNPHDASDEALSRALYARFYQRAYHPEGFKRHLAALICADPRGEALKKLNLPSIIIHGQSDPVFPLEHGQYLAQCLKNSKLHVFKHMGHGIPDHLSEQIAAIIAAQIKQ